MKHPLLEVRDLKKYFPIRAGVLRRPVGVVKAVDGVDLTLGHGEIVGVVGESGCGKSTLARTVIRLIEPTAGSIYYQGRDLIAFSAQDLAALRPEIQIVFQDPLSSLNPRKRIGESLAEPLRFHGLAKDEREVLRRVDETLHQIGLSSDIAHRYPHEYSGGQLQRICIGRAIIMRPKLIICDEAVSSLDVSVQGQIVNLLSDLQRDLSLSYLFIAHDLSIVRHFCDRTYVMYKGQIVEHGPTESLFEHPKRAYTQGLLDAIPPTHPERTG